ncbi:putative myosin-binding protein 5 [Camellia lanceoleosa]|uniref:Myosin-binding protein 5 n=1 Tax=Camellia lanceoleosa TaxID=1840588 RepID=A0ACC0GR24_9ERIC|nr:putative myosin-binding protein 5 [Camellia lanceoleosa]
MIDEQVEYDQEALQVMKDLLMKREEEIKVLEAELKTYRERYGQITRLGSDECEVDADDDYQELKSQSCSSVSEKSDYGSTSGGDHNGENENKERGKRNLDESSLDFEGERSLLFGLLANLEKKFNESSDDGIIPTKSNSDMIKCEAEDIAFSKGSGLQWSFSNKLSALPHFLSFNVGQEEKTTKPVSDPFASSGFKAISTANAFDTTHKCPSGEMQVRTPLRQIEIKKGRKSLMQSDGLSLCYSAVAEAMDSTIGSSEKLRFELGF